MTLARNTVFSAIGQGVPLLVAIVTLPLFIEAIGAARYGALAIAWLALGYFGAADFGLGRAITQRIAAMREAGPNERADAVWSALAGMLGLSLATALVLYVAARWYFADIFEVGSDLRAEALASVWILAASTPVVALTGVMGGALMGLERFGLVAASTVLSRSLILILPLACALLIDPGLPILVLASLVARLLGSALLVPAVWRRFLKGQPRTVSRAELKRLTGFGAWIMITALAAPLMAYADRFVIGAVLGAVAVAAYAIPYDIASRTMMLPGALAQALFPRFAADQGADAAARCRDYSVFVGLLFAPAIAALVCLAGPLLHLWLGDNLDPRSVPIAQIILVGFWTNAIAQVPHGFIQARGDPRFTALLQLAELPLYFALLAWLGSTLGLIGFALAFAMRCAVDALLLLRRAGASGGALLGRLAASGGILSLALCVGMSVTSTTALVGFAIALAGLSSVLGWTLLPNDIRSLLSAIVKSRAAGRARS